MGTPLPAPSSSEVSPRSGRLLSRGFFPVHVPWWHADRTVTVRWARTGLILGGQPPALALGSPLLSGRITGWCCGSPGRRWCPEPSQPAAGEGRPAAVSAPRTGHVVRWPRATSWCRWVSRFSSPAGGSRGSGARDLGGRGSGMCSSREQTTSPRRCTCESQERVALLPSPPPHPRTRGLPQPCEAPGAYTSCAFGSLHQCWGCNIRWW